MECLTAKETIAQTYETLSATSFKEKKNIKIPTQEEINHFLDKILELQRFLGMKTHKINELNSLLEKITWINDLNDDCLKQLNELLAIAKDFHSTIIRQYASLNEIRKRGIAKESTKKLKEAIDNFKENIIDLEATFFLLPNFKGFTETTKELSLL
jgi:two-component SAPR family response regulator